MTKEYVAKSRVHTGISNGRYLSVVIWDDNTVQVCLDGSGMSQVIHLTKEDTEILIDALHGDSHA